MTPSLGFPCLYISLYSENIKNFLFETIKPRALIFGMLSTADFFFKINLFKIFFQEQCQSGKQFGPRSGPTFSRS